MSAVETFQRHGSRGPELNPVATRELGSDGRYHNLASGCDTSDACGLVHGNSVVVAISTERIAGVNANPNPEIRAGDFLLDLGRRIDCGPGRLEHGHGSVPESRHDVAPVAFYNLIEDGEMILEDLRPLLVAHLL